MKVEYIDHCGSDLMCVDAARVSFNKESEWEQVVVSNSEYITHREKFLKDGWRDMTEHYEVREEFTGNNLMVLERLRPTDRGLIRYLAENKHLSPFNHSFISMRIKAPIFVARQLQKHEYMPWNEISRRYVDDPLSSTPLTCGEGGLKTRSKGVRALYRWIGLQKTRCPALCTQYERLIRTCS